MIDLIDRFAALAIGLGFALIVQIVAEALPRMVAA